MPFATLDDARVHLPLDKLELQQADFNRIELDAERIIRGYMANVVPALTIAGWTDPTQTDPTHAGYVPELVRAIAGRFVAAFYYRERYSEDSLEDPIYAQNKYNEAMALLTGIVSGTIIMTDLTVPIDAGERLTSEDFWPNSTDAGPMFTVDDKFFSILGTGGR
jgi:hypothetical protein